MKGKRDLNEKAHFPFGVGIKRKIKRFGKKHLLAYGNTVLKAHNIYYLLHPHRRPVRDR